MLIVPQQCFVTKCAFQTDSCCVHLVCAYKLAQHLLQRKLLFATTLSLKRASLWSQWQVLWGGVLQIRIASTIRDCFGKFQSVRVCMCLSVRGFLIGRCTKRPRNSMLLLVNRSICTAKADRKLAIPFRVQLHCTCSTTLPFIVGCMRRSGGCGVCRVAVYFCRACYSEVRCQVGKRNCGHV
jgi:hypothetical protein